MESGFVSHLIIDQLSDRVFELTTALVYDSELLSCRIIVPAGFQSDGASVPRVPVAYYLWGDRAHHAAVIHDYLYRIDSFPGVSCSTANSVFLEAMKARGVSWWIRWPMYWGVCLGGGFSYHKRSVNDRLI